MILFENNIHNLFFFFILGIAIGAIIVWIISRSFFISLKKSNEKQLQLKEEEINEQDSAHDKLMLETSNLKGKLAVAIERLNQVQSKYKLKIQTDQEKIDLLQRSEQRLLNQFESISNKLFAYKLESVDKQNILSMDKLLAPLKEQLEGFKQQLHLGLSEQEKERHTLVHEIKNLQELNQVMSSETANLTKALKGENKTQGNWGEMVLSKLLEDSGLRAGIEYEVQVNLKQAGKSYRPDVVVHLPTKKDIIIDSKMVLVAYEKYFNDEYDNKDLYLKQHIQAIKTHIKQLSEKKYQDLTGVNTLDFVLMFIPLESAFQLAIAAEPNLITQGLNANILLVSPTTLMVALRTISNLWQHERQNKNAQLIAEKATKLYDKVRLFIDDLEQIGLSLEKSNQAYHSAVKKLATGRGNILTQIESFKELGIEVKQPINSFKTDKNNTNFDR